MDLEYVQSNPPEKVEILSGEIIFFYILRVNRSLIFRTYFLKELFNVPPEKVKKDINIFPRFLCDYGHNIEFKGNCVRSPDLLTAGLSVLLTYHSL